MAHKRSAEAGSKQASGNLLSAHVRGTDLKLAREAAKMNGELKGLQRGRSEQESARERGKRARVSALGEFQKARAGYERRGILRSGWLILSACA